MTRENRILSPKMILVSPKGSSNVGGIARLMGNFELDELRVVEPRCELFDRDARMMGLKNHKILQSAKVFESLDQAQEDLAFTVALSMRPGSRASPFIPLTDLFSSPELSPPAHQPWGFVFGREDNGLEVEELKRCNIEVFLPSAGNRSSLNIVSAAAITLFHYFSHLKMKALDHDKESLPKKLDEEIFFESLSGLLTHIEFVKGGERQRMLFDLRDLYRRARVSKRDLRILFGVLADLQRKLGHSFIPKSSSELVNKSYTTSQDQ